MRRTLGTVVVAIILASLTLTWMASADLRLQDGRCTRVQHKPSFSFGYSERRVCP